MGVNRYLGGVITANQNPPTVESASGTWTLEEAYQNIGNWPMAQNTVYDSLKFNSADSAYLSRTPASASNRRTYTLSFWLKKTKNASDYRVMSAGSGTSNTQYCGFQIANDDCFGIGEYNSTWTWRIETTAVFRDPSSWYHFVAAVDTTQATSSNRVKLYVNGVQQTALNYSSYPTQNYDTFFNSTNVHAIGARQTTPTGYIDGYLTEVNFIDGLALDVDYFGFFDANGIWQPRAYKGAYGTNGFYLPMRESATAAGFSTVTYTGTATTNNVTGVGFAPDFVWIKDREYASGSDHFLFDSLRTTYSLSSNTTGAETQKNNDGFTSLDSDGFTLNGSGGGDNINRSGSEMVAWCWDAGSSTVTNNDGTINSTVRANQTYGISVITYTGDGTSGATVGHGLAAEPYMMILKARDQNESWGVYHKYGNASPQNGFFRLEGTGTFVTSSSQWNNTAPGLSVFTLGNDTRSNRNGYTYVMYAFAEKAGFSKFGSYTGNGSASGPTVTLGFRPAFVMIKKTSDVDDWAMFDTTRQPTGALTKFLSANSSGAEQTGTSPYITVSDTGFQITATSNLVNTSSGTYMYMAFADTRAYSAFDDYSGNGNNWYPNNIGTDDVYVDVPTNWGTDTGVGGEVRGNYATLNPLDEPSSYAAYGSASNGNLTFSVSNDAAMGATFAVSSGKWYWEMTVVSGHSAGSNTVWAAIASSTPSSVNKLPNQSGSGGRSYATTGSKFNENTSSSYGNTYTNGDVIGCALDLDNGKVYWSKNGTFQASGDPVAGTNAAFTGLTGTWLPVAFSNAPVISFNFGATPFAYTAPSGFKALCTQNLPEPTIADGEDYMDALLWTGNGSTQNITGLSFQPDLVWTKDRGAAYDHTWFDAVRGATKFLRSNATSAEETQSDSLTSFNSNGFSVGADAVRNNINKSGASYVSWNWKANGAGVTNNVGDIQSTVSANTTAGFSVVTYTGNATSGATVGHGLSAQPSMIIVKDRTNGTKPWAVYHASVSGAPGNILYLNSTSGANADNQFNVTPTSTVFSLGSGTYTNNSGDNYVAYCFAPIAGYSAFGSYTGNGSTDGPFVYCGFRPRYVMIKNYTSSGNGWILIDTARSTYNQTALQIYANSSAAEASSTAYLDILSNGFKARSGNSDINDSAVGYIYAAFAENPFKLSRAR